MNANIVSAVLISLIRLHKKYLLWIENSCLQNKNVQFT